MYELRRDAYICSFIGGPEAEKVGTSLDMICT